MEKSMRISKQRLSQIIAEEYARARQASLMESAQYRQNNIVKLDAQSLRQIIMQEARAMQQERLQETRTIKLDAQSLRRIIMQEAKKYQ
jgi:hypothetical protein